MSANALYLWCPASFEDPAAASPTSLADAMAFAEQWESRPAKKPTAQRKLLTDLAKQLAAEAGKPHRSDAFARLYESMPTVMAAQVKQALIALPVEQGWALEELLPWLVPACAERGLMLLDMNTNLLFTPEHIYPLEEEAAMRDQLADAAYTLREQELEAQRQQATPGLLAEVREFLAPMADEIRLIQSVKVRNAFPFPKRQPAMAKTVLEALTPLLNRLGYTEARERRKPMRYLFVREEVYGRQIIRLSIESGKWGYQLYATLYINAPRLWEPYHRFFPTTWVPVSSVLRTKWRNRVGNVGNDDDGEVEEPNLETGEHFNEWTVALEHELAHIQNVDNWISLNRAVAYIERRIAECSHLRSYASLYHAYTHEWNLFPHNELPAFTVETESDSGLYKRRSSYLPQWLMLARLAGDTAPRALAERLLSKLAPRSSELDEFDQKRHTALQAALPAYLDYLQALDIQAHGQVNRISPAALRDAEATRQQSLAAKIYPESAYQVPFYIWPCSNLVEEGAMDTKRRADFEAQLQAGALPTGATCPPASWQEADAFFQHWQGRKAFEDAHYNHTSIAKAILRYTFEEDYTNQFAQFYANIEHACHAQIAQGQGVLRIPATPEVVQDLVNCLKHYGGVVIRSGEPPEYYVEHKIKMANGAIASDPQYRHTFTAPQS